MLWAAESAVSGTWVTVIVTGLLSGGLGATVVALAKVRVDKGRIVIETAQGAVIVQSGVMVELRAELNRLKAEVEELRADRDAEVGRLRAEVEVLRAGRDVEVAELRAEVARLRSDAAGLSGRVSAVEQGTEPGLAGAS